MVKIRWAREQDIDGLLTVEEQCFSVYYYGQYILGREDFRGFFQADPHIFLVATSNTRPLGYIVGPVTSSRARPIAHVESIGVLPKARNKGFGSQLLQSFIEQARLRHCKMVMLEVATANETGLAFFSKRGFRVVREMPDYYGKNLEGVLMVIDI